MSAAAGRFATRTCRRPLPPCSATATLPDNALFERGGRPAPEGALRYHYCDTVAMTSATAGQFDP